MDKEIFEQTVELLRCTGYQFAKSVKISVPEAEQHLRGGIKFFCGDKAVWRDEYKPVVKWLTDNKGKGLLLSGNFGTGKSLIGGKIIPVLLYHYCDHLMCFQYQASAMNGIMKEILSHRIVYIDDLGTETLRNDYGNKDVAFNQLIDATEREGKLLIVSTNLPQATLQTKYGERTMDRLRGLTKLVQFNGKSLRQ